MIRIDTDQLNDMIRKDKEIQKELKQILKDDQKNYDLHYEKYINQQERWNHIKQERETLAKKIQNQENFEDQFHSRINFLEIQKIFAKRKLKRIFKMIDRCETEEEKQTLLLKAEMVQQEINDICIQQDSIREEIEDNHNIVASLKQKERDLVEQEEEAKKETEYLKKNVVEWQLAMETKTNLFYQETFDTMMTYYDPLRNLLVRNLEKEKALTKDEAKNQTDGIIIDSGIEPGEVILVDPPGYVKRLTKEKRGEYRCVKKM